MITRLKFAVLAAGIGGVFGIVVALVVQGSDEPFPAFIVIAFVSIFAVCGALSKRERVDSVLDFFANVLP